MNQKYLILRRKLSFIPCGVWNVVKNVKSNNMTHHQFTELTHQVHLFWHQVARREGGVNAPFPSFRYNYLYPSPLNLIHYLKPLNVESMPRFSNMADEIKLDNRREGGIQEIPHKLESYVSYSQTEGTDWYSRISRTYMLNCF